MSKVITIREAYDWLTDEHVTAQEMTDLIRYMESRHPGKRVMELQYRRLRFINFVGIVQCGAVRYEIVPKIALSKSDDKKALLQMIEAARFLPVHFENRTAGSSGKSSLLDAFAAAFTARLLDEFRKGLFRTYERRSGNMPLLRGKLHVTQHVRQNALHPVRAFCSFDEQTENTALNQLFKAALLLIARHSQHPRITGQVHQCLSYLTGVEAASLHSPILWNRQNERFREAALFAEMITENTAFYGQGMRGASFSFLLPIHALFEKYVHAALTRAAAPEKVISQPAEKRLLRNVKTGYGNVLLKPDFLVGDRLIADAKWKSAASGERVRYDQADIYQMYAYINAYEKASRCVLVYPAQEGIKSFPVWQVPGTRKTIEMHAVRLDSFAETVRDLQTIIKQAPDLV